MKILYYLMMTTPHLKFVSHLRSGRVYRREELLRFSKAVDRDLMLLTNSKVLKKVAAGLYYKPAKSDFGVLPPDDAELVKSFLKGDPFLLYSWNHYNSLGLGLTQLYHQSVVYNHKRHGLFKLGNKEFNFCRPSRGFPKELTPEFLLVDLVNNLNDLAEDANFIKEQIHKRLSQFNFKKVVYYAKKYGKVGTKCFFEEIAHHNNEKEMTY